MSAAVLGSWGVLSVCLGAACAFDVRARRIPNALSVAAGLAGVLLHAALPAGAGLFAPAARGGLGAAGAALGLLLALAAGLALWRARLFGAGDAKLLAAVGAFTGAAGVLPVLLWSLLAGGALAVCLAVPAMLRGTTPRPMPYALALAGGTFAHAAAACSGLYGT